MLVKWDKSLDIGVEEVDQAHRRFYDIINEIADHLNTQTPGSNSDFIEKCLTELIDYSYLHFDLEEKLMSEMQYPQYEAHKKSHAFYCKKIVNFKQVITDFGATQASTIILDYLVDWLSQHIKKMDKDFAVFYTSKKNT